MLANTATLTAAEEAGLVHAVLYRDEPENTAAITALLRAGKDPRRIIDALQIAAAQLTIDTHGANNFSMPMHCYEYSNALGWFYDNFDHPRRLRLLYVAASFANRVAESQVGLNDSTPFAVKAPAGASAMTAGQILDRVESAILNVNIQDSADWTQAYIENVTDKAPLVQRIALTACRMGNDPHNQEIAQCMLMDWGTNQQPNRDILLLAAAWHTAGHRKYGDVQEPSRRFGQAFGHSELV